ncbi:TIGR02677 family protein [Streptomyces sp. NPDC086554]|uniref:TIGR02677 family protein n=1 Tax=Streptomyces sp. NPDC086554 TaxID=3154864 RepID=UPI00343E8839
MSSETSDTGDESEGAGDWSGSLGSGGGRMPIVEYLVDKHAVFLRLALDVLMDEEARLGIHLPVGEIAARVAAAHAASGRGGDIPLMENLLAELYRNGNVDRIQNTRRKDTVQEYLRRDHLYQLTPQGAQIHREVVRIDREMGTTGSLQASMLPAVLQALDELTALLDRPHFDPAVAYAAYHRLTRGFFDLSENAKLFVQGLNRSLEVDGELQVEAFLAYKDVVVSYLRTFIVSLERHTPRIAHGIGQAEQAGLFAWFGDLAAVDAGPVLGRSREDVVERERRRMVEQWSGLRSWFHGDEDRPPVTDILQERAAEAVSQIMQIVQQLNDRRFRRVNRIADLTTLARWFENAPDQRAVSGLWRAAFGMNPARHLGHPHPLDDDADHLPDATWWNDSPAPVSARLRQHGPRASTGAPPAIADTRAAKRSLADRQARHHEARATAEDALIARGPTRLSALVTLPAGEAALLLRCLTIALSARRGEDGLRRARTSDGRLLVVLAPPARPADSARIGTPDGQLALQDFEITVSSLAGASA